MKIITNKTQSKQSNKKFKFLIFFSFFVVFVISIFFIFRKLRNENRSENEKEKKFENDNKIKNGKFNYDYYKPVLPLNEDDTIVKPFTKTNYNSSHIRYHFQDLYENRKIFQINYNYLPYTQIDKQKSFEENAKNIYETTGLLNLTKLNIYYNNKNIDTSKFNHIHLAMGFNKDYIVLSVISMASILKTSSPDTYIHFHLALLSDIQYEDLKIIIDLNKINENVEFVFYNSRQAEYDFEEKKAKGGRGLGDYTRILLPEIVNNTNRIIIMDSADIIVQKDLSELYFFDIGNNYFAFALNDIAGKLHDIFIFGRNKFYSNTGICLVNIRKFREDNLYRNAFFATMAYEDLPCPYQDILFMVSNYKFKYWPLNYNCPQFFSDDEINLKDFNSKNMKFWLSYQENSPFRYSKEEMLEASKNPVILHLYANKPFRNYANSNNTLAWINYAKMAGVYNEMKNKYPNVFKRFNLE